MKMIKEVKRDQFEYKEGVLVSSIVRNTTLEVSKLYSEAPFPNYQGYENKFTLTKSILDNAFLNDLKKQIGFGKKLIEVGSGTCQLSLALASGTNNVVVAMDATIESLRLGRNFAKKNNINNVVFLKADIFDDVMKDDYFDLVWCSGVLHHTKNPKRGVEIISKWVKEDGLLIVGVYNKIGRLRTNVRQIIYKAFNKNSLSLWLISVLDPYLRKTLSKEKREAWINDQYNHPLETKHSIDEVIGWFDDNNITFLGSIPNPTLEFKKVSEMDGDKSTFSNRIFAQIMMLFSEAGGEGGLSIVVGKKGKKSQRKNCD